MSKTVTSAGHDEERIGAFLMEGDAKDEQLAVAAPPEPTEPSPAPGEVDAAIGSAMPKDRDDDAGVPGRLASSGNDGLQSEQVHQGGDALSDGAAKV